MTVIDEKLENGDSSILQDTFSRAKRNVTHNVIADEMKDDTDLRQEFTGDHKDYAAKNIVRILSNI